MFEYQLGILHKLYNPIIVLIAIVIAVKLLKNRDTRRRKLVSENSRYIGKIIEISKLYGINFLLKEKYTRPFLVKSKSAVDNFNFRSKIIEDIDKNQKMYQDLYHDSVNNSDCWEDFLKEASKIDRIKPDANFLKFSGIGEDAFIKYENEFIMKLLRDRPVQNPTIEYLVKYTSPKGRNYHWNSREIKVGDLPFFFGEIEKLNAYRESAQYQRRLITLKRRLEIIAKDGGRCCLCGRAARDGVQLDVDHFIPVSKGGKSTDDNLWTLCHDCNLGKSNFTIEELQDVFNQAMAERK